MGTNYTRKRFTNYEGKEQTMRCTYFRTSDVFMLQIDDDPPYAMDATAMEAMRDCIEGLRRQVAAVDRYQPSDANVEHGP